MTAWLAFVAAAAGLVGYAVWTYRSRELPIRGRGALAALRSLTLVLVLLLLWNPAVPGEPAFGAARSWLLLDASASMAAPVEADGSTAWDAALAAVASDDGEAYLATFGAAVEPQPDGPPAAPAAAGSVLAPALARAAEGGARRVTVVSDLRLEDPVAVAAAVDRLGLDVTWVDVGGDLRNAGVESLTAPAAVAADEAPRVEVAVFASGTAPGDSVDVEVLEEGRPVASRRVAAPGEGRRARLSLALPPPDDEGSVRYTARVALAGDVVASDDEAAAYVAVASDEGALVLVSLAPDWEPRFLLPVLAGVTGLRTRGFLAAGPGRFLPVGGGGAVDVDAVARASTAAELLVVHGLGDAPPPWLRNAVDDARRVVVLPSTADGAGVAGVAAGAPRGGEWYVSSDLPPSPLAGDLAGAPVGALPPLGPVLPADDATVGEAVFLLQLRGSGPSLPGLVLRREEGRRVATALASGFWRWAFRPGDGRETYRRLWSGVAGWLLAETAVARGGGVAPTERVVEPGRAPLWTAGSGEGPVALRITRDGATVLDTTVAAPPTGTFRTPPLAPGTYAYRAGVGDEVSEGRFDVARPPELAHPRTTPPSAGAAGAAAAGAPVRRPVRTHPLPYLLLLGLLGVEWTVRRRRGLR